MSDDSPMQAKVLTVSDGVFHGVRDDTGGRGLTAHLAANGFEVVDHRVSSDGADEVARTLVEMSDGFAGLIKKMKEKLDKMGGAVQAAPVAPAAPVSAPASAPASAAPASAGK